MRSVKASLHSWAESDTPGHETKTPAGPVGTGGRCLRPGPRASSPQPQTWRELAAGSRGSAASLAAMTFAGCETSLSVSTAET